MMCVLLTLFATGAIELAATPAANDREKPADFVLHAKRIWTGDPEHPWAESLAARGGTLAVVGTRSDVELLSGPLTTVLELPTAFATPGLIDAHGHLASLGETLEHVDLRDLHSIDEVVQRIRERAATAGPGEWVVGQGWDQSLWPGKELPSHQPLSTALPDRPVLLRRVDGHAVWVNSAALAAAGITHETSDPAGGKILRDRDGNPSGVLLDNAADLVGRKLPGSSRDALRRQFLAAQRLAFAAGLTGVHDAGESARDIDVLRSLDASRELKLRVYGMAAPPGGREVEFVSRPARARAPHERYTLRAIKMFIDGAMGSRGAALFDDYSDDPGNRGLILTEPDQLQQITAAALANGWQVCTHAIGDRGNRLVLDAYESALRQSGKPDHRLRIEHAQLVAIEDIPRFARLGVIASMQPTHATSDMRWAMARVGPSRIAGAYAWRRFIDSGVTLAFGSDFPVERVDPTLGLYAAITRQDLLGNPPGGFLPDQRIGLIEALRAFTAGAAFASFDELQLGILRPGMACDVSVFDRELTQDTPMQIAEANVLATVIAGEIVYRASK